MRKFLAFAFVLLEFAVVGNAQVKGNHGWLNFGLEWGYSQTFLNIHHFNYTSESEGYRVDDYEARFRFNANAMIMGKIGIDISDYFELSVCSGYVGISKNVRVIPALLRFSIYPGMSANDGFFYFTDWGVGFHVDIPGKTPIAALGCVGAGYRVQLSSILDLDFMVSVKGAYDHPQLVASDGSIVPDDNLRRNNAAYSALNFSVSLCF